MPDPIGRPDPRLGRLVNHDPRSRRFPVRATETDVQSVQHERHVPVFEQGDIGSCTGNAALGCLGTGLFFATVDTPAPEYYPFDQAGAVAVYSEATRIDPFEGTYPPDDTGSDGLSVAKVLKSYGLISGYEWAFDLNSALLALMSRPFITGTLWTEGMSEPDAEGIARPTGRELGGHEYVCDGLDVNRGLLWFTNSWGEGWGKAGRFAIPVEEYGDLLGQQGDVTFFVAFDRPAPVPVPGPSADDADVVLAAAVGKWARRDGTNNRAKRRAIVRWLNEKGL